MHDASECSESSDQTERRGNPARRRCVLASLLCTIKLFIRGGLQEGGCRERESLSYDPEVATATAPSSQLEEGASKASQHRIGRDTSDPELFNPK